MTQSTDSLEQIRLTEAPKLPKIFQNFHLLAPIQLEHPPERSCSSNSLFPLTGSQLPVSFSAQNPPPLEHSLKIGVVFSGGQAPGGHNVITGLFDALHLIHPESVLIGFLNGPSGLINEQWKRLDKETVDRYRNMGGFDMIGAGRTKVETAAQFASVRTTVQTLELDGLVIIGGDDSNTNAAFLAEDFCSHQIKTCVVGVPKTIDGDLKNEWIETSFGFDTACKTYSETIGNMSRDAKSAGKYYYFVKLMGRSASHIALECALQTCPNLTLISEEIERDKKSLQDISHEISDLISRRAKEGKDYGVILIPEGILEFIPECKQLIQELNRLLIEGTPQAKTLAKFSTNQEKIKFINEHLSSSANQCYQFLPLEIQLQLILDRDSHGNVQVSKIETERLFIELVKKELQNRAEAGSYKGKFSPQPHFCGYEGRSSFPSNFDANYCYSLGYTAALLVKGQLNGYMACVRHLSKPVDAWEIAGVLLASMMHLEVRKGKSTPVIKKALVDLEGSVFKEFAKVRGEWSVNDAYKYPGPIQFFGPAGIAETITRTLKVEKSF